MLKEWDQLPEFMRSDTIKSYYSGLRSRQRSLRLKRIFDMGVGLAITVILSPVMGILAIWIKTDSKGPVFYRQERVTQYGKVYRIFKFRTMVIDADKKGPLVTAGNDSRITKVGSILRKYRLDELPQLLNVLAGDMSFVGTRPEVIKYVEKYSDEMNATLLLPAGITSKTSMRFKDEDRLLERYMKKTGKTADEAYVEYILPKKMKYNLEYLEKFSFWQDIRIMVETVFAVLH